MAVAAASLAWDDADCSKLGDPETIGVIIGSGIGGLNEFEEQHRNLMEKGASRISPFTIPKLMVVIVWDGTGCNTVERWDDAWPNLRRLERDARRLGTGEMFTSPKVLYDLWIECAEAAFSKMAHGPEYARIQGELTNTLSSLRTEQRKLFAGVQTCVGYLGNPRVIR
jgi:hypothetical protein